MDASGEAAIGVSRATNSSTPTTLKTVPPGHGRAAPEIAAAREHSLPSVAKRTYIGWDDGAAPPAGNRTISTGQGAILNTACATLPKRKRPIALWPCEPTMIRSACNSFAHSEMTFRGKPSLTSASALCPAWKKPLGSGVHQFGSRASGVPDHRWKPGEALDVNHIQYKNLCREAKVARKLRPAHAL